VHPFTTLQPIAGRTANNNSPRQHKARQGCLISTRQEEAAHLDQPGVAPIKHKLAHVGGREEQGLAGQDVVKGCVVVGAPRRARVSEKASGLLPLQPGNPLAQVRPKRTSGMSCHVT